MVTVMLNLVQHPSCRKPRRWPGASQPRGLRQSGAGSKTAPWTLNQVQGDGSLP